MSDRLLASCVRDVHTEDPTVSLEGLQDGSLLVHGKKIYDMVVCWTCEFLFKYVDSAKMPLTTQTVAALLNAGIQTLKPAMMESLETILPSNRYHAMLLEISPKAVKEADEQNTMSLKGPSKTGTDYYWKSYPAQDDLEAIEFFLPLQSPRLLQVDAVNAYVDRIQKGEKPTAVALSMHYEYKRDSEDPAVYNLVHYLLDGHHKVAAAAKCQRPITLLSYHVANHIYESGLDVAVVDKVFGLDLTRKDSST